MICVAQYSKPLPPPHPISKLNGKYSSEKVENLRQGREIEVEFLGKVRCLWFHRVRGLWFCRYQGYSSMYRVLWFNRGQF